MNPMSPGAGQPAAHLGRAPCPLKTPGNTVVRAALGGGRWGAAEPVWGGQGRLRLAGGQLWWRGPWLSPRGSTPSGFRSERLLAPQPREALRPWEALAVWVAGV